MLQSFPLVLLEAWRPVTAATGLNCEQKLPLSQETLTPIFFSFTTHFLMRGTASCAPLPICLCCCSCDHAPSYFACELMDLGDLEGWIRHCCPTQTPPHRCRHTLTHLQTYRSCSRGCSQRYHQAAAAWFVALPRGSR